MESIENIFKSLKVVTEMLEDRNYDLCKLQQYSEIEISTIYKSNAIFELDVNDNLRLIYHVNSKFKLTDFKKYMNPSLEDKRKIILVIKDKVTNINQKNINEYINSKIEIFSINEVLFNISKHVYVPKHEIVNNDKKYLIEKYNLKCVTNLPIILKSDPMAKYLNIQSGDIVKITRHSPCVGEFVMYRYCV